MAAAPVKGAAVGETEALDEALVVMLVGETLVLEETSCQPEETGLVVGETGLGVVVGTLWSPQPAEEVVVGATGVACHSVQAAVVVGATGVSDHSTHAEEAVVVGATGVSDHSTHAEEAVVVGATGVSDHSTHAEVVAEVGATGVSDHSTHAEVVAEVGATGVASHE